MLAPMPRVLGRCEQLHLGASDSNSPAAHCVPDVMFKGEDRPQRGRNPAPCRSEDLVADQRLLARVSSVSRALQFRTRSLRVPYGSGSARPLDPRPRAGPVLPIAPRGMNQPACQQQPANQPGDRGSTP